MKEIDLSIVIPAYREEKRIGKTLDQLSVFLKTDEYLMHKIVEVIVVSADANDKTKEVVRSRSTLFPNFTFVEPGARVGKGRDVKAGVQRAVGKAILFMDADLATPLEHIVQFYKLYEQGAAIIIATRGINEHSKSVVRSAVSIMGNLLYRLLGGVWLEDSQCGFKMFSADAAQICFGKLKILGWGFDMELLTAAKTNHIVITTVHIDDWRAVPDGTFEVNIIANSLRSFADLLKIFCRRLSGYYKSTESKSIGEL